MRDQGGKHLRLNVPLFPGMKVDKSGDKSVRFVAFLDNAVTSYAIRVSRKEEAEELMNAIELNKGAGETNGTSTSTTETTKKGTSKKEAPTEQAST